MHPQRLNRYKISLPTDATHIRTAGGGNPAAFSPLSPLTVPLLLLPRQSRRGALRAMRGGQLAGKHGSLAGLAARLPSRTAPGGSIRPGLAGAAELAKLGPGGG